MRNPHEDITLSMALLRSNVPGKSEEFKQASGKYNAKLKTWQIRAINYTIIVGLLSLITFTIYSIV
jgi:hypothetical protein